MVRHRAPMAPRYTGDAPNRNLSPAVRWTSLSLARGDGFRGGRVSSDLALQPLPVAPLVRGVGGSAGLPPDPAREQRRKRRHTVSVGRLGADVPTRSHSGTPERLAGPRRAVQQRAASGTCSTAGRRHASGPPRPECDGLARTATLAPGAQPPGAAPADPTTHFCP